MAVVREKRTEKKAPFYWDAQFTRCVSYLEDSLNCLDEGRTMVYRQDPFQSVLSSLNVFCHKCTCFKLVSQRPG
jgi:hypothetical protein